MPNALNPTSVASLLALAEYLRAAGYRFVTPTPATHHRVNSRPGNERARLLTDIFGWSRPFARSTLPGALFEILRDGAIIREEEVGWKSSVRASTLDGELFLHSAFPTLSAEAVFFGPDTYRFARTIKDKLGLKPPRLGRVLDIGCGTGAGAVVVAKNAVCDEVIMTDINAAACSLARLNADAAGVSATIAHGDLFANITGEFDLIVANPPFLNDPLQRAYRHGGGELGSALSIRIAEAAKDRLTPEGSLILYTGSPIVNGTDDFLRAIERGFGGRDLVWSYEEVDPDVFGDELETEAYSSVDRIAAVVLTARKPGVFTC
jgi:methylase of polypeptide subunit release factors